MDRHAVQTMLSAGLSAGEVARHFGISGRTVRRARKKVRVETADDASARRTRRAGRPRVPDRARERMRVLIVRFGGWPGRLASSTSARWTSGSRRGGRRGSTSGSTGSSTRGGGE
jgi:hypothetical protein